MPQGHIARKRFGQNFLADADIIARIIEAIGPRPSRARCWRPAGICTWSKLTAI
jgi:hypothetical protein